MVIAATTQVRDPRSVVDDMRRAKAIQIQLPQSNWVVYGGSFEGGGEAPTTTGPLSLVGILLHPRVAPCSATCTAALRSPFGHLPCAAASRSPFGHLRRTDRGDPAVGARR